MSDLEGFAYDNGLDIVELPLKYTLGLLHGKLIVLRKGMPYTQRRCILAEEIGHGLLTVGNITDQGVINNRKQEQKARRWAFNRLISQEDLVRAAKAGCRNAYEISDFLDITEEFLQESVQDFKRQYGTAYTCDSFVIMYEPYLMVYDIDDLET